MDLIRKKIYYLQSKQKHVKTCSCMIKSRDGFIADYLVSVETQGQLNGTSGSKHEKTLRDEISGLFVLGSPKMSALQSTGIFLCIFFDCFSKYR